MKLPEKQVIIGSLPFVRVTRNSIILPRVPWGPKGVDIVNRAIPKIINICRSGHPYRGTLRNWLSQFLKPHDLLELDLEFLGAGLSRSVIDVIVTPWSSQDHVEKFDDLRNLEEYRSGGKACVIDAMDPHGLVARVKVFRHEGFFHLSAGSPDPSNFMNPPVASPRRLFGLLIATSAKKLR